MWAGRLSSFRIVRRVGGGLPMSRRPPKNGSIYMRSLLDLGTRDGPRAALTAEGLADTFLGGIDDVRL